MGNGKMTVAEAGKKGGQSDSKEKVAASRTNGKMGGAPRRRRIETLLDRPDNK